LQQQQQQQQPPLCGAEAVVAGHSAIVNWGLGYNQRWKEPFLAELNCDGHLYSILLVRPLKFLGLWPQQQEGGWESLVGLGVASFGG
jgi:hypothetical protein